ncbi:MAG: DUF4037 domain-containing protein [Bacilli bacterium]|nr:DUF4037 domain-containing protein [Bacilli bacterium]
MPKVSEKNKAFYEKKVRKMIHDRFSSYEPRIAVGLVGEGSDCFGYDDELSRDHDFGTGVCLWLNEEDYSLIGEELSKAYGELVDEKERSFMTKRLKERRGVHSIRAFYSNILGIEIDPKNPNLSEEQWKALDHSCLKTATNGVIFRDDLGEFTRFRNYLLSYYPEKIWRMRIAEQLHKFASSFQTNYSRCMARKDIVTATLCKAKGMEAAMELFFLLNRVYPPYYKWTFHALKDLDKEGVYSKKLESLAEEPIRLEAWEGSVYLPHRQNYKDMNVCICEEIASEIEELLFSKGLIHKRGRYLEAHVDEVLGNI